MPKWEGLRRTAWHLEGKLVEIKRWQEPWQGCSGEKVVEGNKLLWEKIQKKKNKLCSDYRREFVVFGCMKTL